MVSRPVRLPGVVVGVIDGAVLEERARAGRHGLDVLVGVHLLIVLGAITQTARTGRTGLVAWLLLPALVIGGPAALVWWRRHQRRPAGTERPEPGGEPVRRFRVRSVGGEAVACIVRGELTGDHLRHGDVVQVTGRQGRDGAFLARYVDVLDTPVGPVISRVTGRRGLRRQALEWGDRLAYALAGLGALWAVLTLTFLVTPR